LGSREPILHGLEGFYFLEAVPIEWASSSSTSGFTLPHLWSSWSASAALNHSHLGSEKGAEISGCGDYSNANDMSTVVVLCPVV
jgi:hypothetical protein